MLKQFSWPHWRTASALIALVFLFNLLFHFQALAQAILVEPSTQAGCVVNGSVETCTGNPGAINVTSQTISTLNVNNLTANLPSASLTVEGAQPVGNVTLVYACSVPGHCTFGVNEITQAPYCSVNANAPAGTTCVQTPTSAGASGFTSPNINVNVATSSQFQLTPGGVLAASTGQAGANGQNAGLFSNATNGAPGADGGSAKAIFSGHSNVSSGRAAVGVSSVAGMGGNGGDSSSISFGDPGAGGLGGDAEIAQAQLLSGSAITTTSNDTVGIGAFSLGGKSGAGGNNSGFISIPGGTSAAGAGGLAQVFAFKDASITTYGVSSFGVQARSVGGGGGPAGGGFGIFWSDGADGGTGGDGGDVQVGVGANAQGGVGRAEAASAGIIKTFGQEAFGILAQSIGGGGGTTDRSVSLFVLGGTGGAGGAGGNVTVANANAIRTLGDDASGIFAQSTGGAGGFAKNSGGAIVIGGDGAGAASGGSVGISNYGDISVQGNRASGIEAQSTGGGGGKGASTLGLVSLGGSGGEGANGGNVTVTNAGNITTGNSANETTNSKGILAQSIGGGGGNGGGALAINASVLVNPSVAVGGAGGIGGNGGNVSVLTDNKDPNAASAYSIQTVGDQSDAIYAESTGGGGGASGNTISLASGVAVNMSVGVGRSGGTGGDGGNVDVQTKGSLMTQGNQSAGLFAHSEGKGGGSAGFVITGSAVASSGMNLNVAVGGDGGEGGNGGRVNVSNYSTISTAGEQSPGIDAQSIGGGGGKANFIVNAQAGIAVGSNVTLGGQGGDGGAGSNVSVNNFADITTKGIQSTAIEVASIGHGGGDAEFINTAGIGQFGLSLGLGGSGGTGGSAGDVSLISRGAIATSGDNSRGLSAQSIGKGGGNGATQVNIPLGFTLNLGSFSGVQRFVNGGPNGGAGGFGGQVSLSNVGSITTTGQSSTGILAESIGGGGGNGGGVVLFSLNMNPSSILPPKAAELVDSITANIQSITNQTGGTGGSGDFASKVSVENTGLISTTGQQSEGVVAQSIGGGGGRGGFVISGMLDFSPESPERSEPPVTTINTVGGTGGQGGNSSSVSVTLNAGANGFTVQTTGDGAEAILAQSIGGGGGKGGFSISGGLSTNSALAMQSIGGTGGDAGSSLDDGDRPAVQVVNRGSISTAGENASAIVAQSIGGGGGDGGFSIAMGATTSPATTTIQSIGGSGGSSGTGATVNVASNDNDNSQSYIITEQNLSSGIVAQSLGGGGGNGGFALGAGFSLTAESSTISSATTETVVTGGSGGNGNSAGKVTVNAGGGIYTGAKIVNGAIVASGEGSLATAILAQSIGGGGGSGGFAGGLAFSQSGASAANVTGGNGGVGSDGASVTVNTRAGSHIITFGDEASGVIAQSIGGGGGQGGFSIGASIGNSSATNITNSVGGAGGDGGLGSNVTVANNAQITLYGFNSYGILAQSIGGGGGNGGFSVAGSLSLEEGSATTNAVGGQGGSGQNAGIVSVTNTGAISANNVSSSAIVAQSIGGGGGVGGLSGGITFTRSGNLVNTVGATAPSDGGSATGGDAGNGGDVNITNSGAISTKRERSFAILAQSIGGGGGVGGVAVGLSGGGSSASAETATSLTDTVGATGGTGGMGKTVTVSNNTGGLLTTLGDYSSGITAQSIGGGGGNGGFAVAGSLSLSGGSTLNIGAGNGSPGGNGGAVTVSNSNSIQTSGTFASAISAQSIGGGGGDGGIKAGVGISYGADANASSRIGGSGGVAGAANNVLVASNYTPNSSSIILTGGEQSYGILAQSVGGGGGNGGYAFGESIATKGVGQVKNLVGGDGASGNRAGAVTVNAGGSIFTGATILNNLVVASTNGGIGASAIVAQSIGGGGGLGGFSGAYDLGYGAGDATNTIGGAGGNGSDGGAVSVSTSVGSFIATFGDNATAIIAQSVGGGGGWGGFATKSDGSISHANSLSNTIGGSAGDGGAGGAVVVSNNAEISTVGYLSDGLVAQSIGGGGGMGGYAIASVINIELGSPSTTSNMVSSSVGGSGGSGQNGSTVTVTNAGAINVKQAETNGIVAQSIGGGGGSGGYAGQFVFSNTGSIGNNIGQNGSASGGAGSNGAAVTVVNSGAITAQGERGIALLAQSIGGGGGNGGFAYSGGASSIARSLSNTFGGGAGNGGDGGAVTVTNNIGGGIITNGGMGVGISAQSIGGGGGIGGFATTGNLSLNGNSTLNLGAGSGAGGGNAGAVTVDNSSAITTHGAEGIAIIAQSIGGGGGNGGFAGGLNIADNGKLNTTIGANTGVGGQGGTASSVTVTNKPTGAITTNGSNSIGILAQAIAGGGGAGSTSISGNAALGSGIVENVGANGANSGAGGNITAQTIVSVVNDGEITTNGANSTGIVAESIGGGGGWAGSTISGTGSIKSGGEISNNLGGVGGAGGNGGDVSVVNTGNINIKGSGSVGILAQSVGGGGGFGGLVGGLDVARSSFAVVLGSGARGVGGKGGDVTVTNTGSIKTAMDNSTGILTQSIDGGGGFSDWSLTLQKGELTGFQATLGFTSAGSISAGNGSISVRTTGISATAGSLAFGSLTQSIAGGGGAFAFTTEKTITIDNATSGVVQNLGANTTGTAYNAKSSSVTDENSDWIGTTGSGSIGLADQSIGGGGGVEGVVSNLEILNSSPITIAMGSQGAAGGDGGLVKTTYSGKEISTTGAAAAGLITQSIGGGGGVVVDALKSVTGAPLTTSISMGVMNATVATQTHHGGGVQLTSSGDVLTAGKFAPGVVAQTIGGGGGYGALLAETGLNSQNLKIKLGATNTGSASSTAMNSSADINAASLFTIGQGSIKTAGVFSGGGTAQSIGGGGGLFGYYSPNVLADNIVTATLGATGTVSGNGGPVAMTNQSSIVTVGAGAYGLLAQSIGGGGGAVLLDGVNLSNGFSASQVIIGGAAGNAGAVSVKNSAPITTFGAYAYGIVAQSIGGGGGLFMGFDPAGNAVAPAIVKNTTGNGSGSNVTVTVDAPINVIGVGSIGVLAQSIGGGGGYVAGADTNTPGFSGSAGGVGTSGNVTINVNANITAVGFGADAIVAQSADRTGELAGKVAIKIAPGVTVIGDGVSPGPLTSFTDALHTGAGINMSGGSEFTFNNYGTLTVLNGAKGVAILSSSGHDVINNYGYIVGSIASVGLSDTFTNEAFHSSENPIAHAGVFDAGHFVGVGVDGQFINKGVFIVGGYQEGFTTNLTGNFTQTGNGACGSFGAPTQSCGYFVPEVNVANNGPSGLLNVSGKADVSGAVVVKPIKVGFAKPGSGTVHVLHADGGLTTHGLQVQAPASAVASYSLTTTANDIGVNYTVNFGPAGLTFNQRAPASAVNAIQASGAFAGFAPVAKALFAQPNVLALGAAYNSLSGEGVSASQQTTFMANDFLHSSANRQMNFWLYDQEDNSGNSLTLYDDRADVTPDRKWRATASHDNRIPRFAERTWRSWMVGGGGSLSYPGQVSNGSANMTSGGYTFAGGVDRQITPNFLVGVAGGYGTYGFGVQQRQTYGNVYGGHVAGYAAFRGGPFYATGVLSGDFFSNYANRTVSIAGSPTTSLFDDNYSAPGVYDSLNGKFGSRSISGMGEAGYRTKVGRLDVTPFAALQFSSLRADGFNEFNGFSQSVVALNYQGRTISSLPSYAGIQLNHNFDLGNGMPLWGWLRSAWRHEFDQLRTVTTAFMAAPGMNFTTLGAPGVRDMASVSSGVKLGLTPNLILFAGFDGNFAPSAYSVSGSGGLQMRW